MSAAKSTIRHHRQRLVWLASAEHIGSAFRSVKGADGYVVRMFRPTRPVRYGACGPR